MGTTLTGQKIKDTYKSLIKVSDNSEASSTAKQLSDGNGNDFGVYIDTDGVLGVGSAASYSLDISSKTDGVALPVGTTVNRPTGAAGVIRYNSTIGKVEFYDTGWKTVFTTSGGTISGDVIITGDLTVQGDNTIIEAQTVEVEDNILNLNRTQGSPDTATATTSGISIYRGDGVTEASFIFDDTDDTWDLTNNLVVAGNFTANSIIKSGGASNEFLKADGSIDTNSYLTTESDTLDSVTDRGNTTTNSITVNTLTGTISGTSVLADGVTATTQTQGDNSTKIATTAYVDAAVTAEDLDFAGGTGTGSVDLDSETFTIAGTTNEIETSASGQTLTIGLPDDVTITGDLTVDTNTLYVDSTNNNVGIGTATPNDYTGYSTLTFNDATYGGVVDFESNGTRVGSLVMDFSSGILKTVTSIPLIFQTSDTERMRIHSGGDISFRDTSANEAFYWDASTARLGIGTGSSPAANLHISGTSDTGLRIKAGSSALSYIDFDDADSGTPSGSIAYNHIVDAMTFATGGSNTERMRIDSSGRVLIGVTDGAGTVKLTVGDSVNPRLEITPITDAINIEVLNDARNLSKPLKIYAEQTIFHSRNHPAAYAEAMRIDSSGNLKVKGTNTKLSWERASDSAPDVVYLTKKEDISSNGNAKLHGYDGIVFSTAGSETERMRIDSSGNVGIGTTSPDAKLTAGSNLNNTASFDRNFQTRNALIAGLSGTAEAKLYLHRDDVTIGVNNILGEINFSGQDGGSYVGASIKGVAAGTWGSTTSHSDLTFQTTSVGSTSPTERMRITSGGNVLVGKTADDDNTTGIRLAEFGVLSASRVNNVALILNRTGTDGSIAYFRNDSVQAGDISVSGSTTSYNTSSDYRLKENVVPMEGALGRVDALKPSRFNFIADADKTVDGFLAHEVAEVVPEAISGEKDAVDEDGNPVYQGIDQSKLVPLLVGAIQEQQEIINDLKARIETLENQ